MNQLIKTSEIDFKTLVTSNNNNLSDIVKSKITDELKNVFTEDEQKWYIANLYMYLNYHPTNEFPINLETIWSMIGFANKGNAKRTLENNFTKDEDYKVILLPREKKQNAGRCEEEITMNVDTFKNLCMISKTEKGKEIRKYYVKMENILNKIINEELKDKDNQLKDKDNKLKETTTLLEQTKKQLKENTRLETNKWYNCERGNYVYIYTNEKIDDDTENETNKTSKSIIQLKIGKTDNLKKRESFYKSANKNGEIVYVHKCHDCDLIEKVCHHILDKYRIHKNKEWFEMSIELAKYIIESVCLFIDSFINSSELLPKLNIKENLLESFNLMKNLLPAPTLTESEESSEINGTNQIANNVEINLSDEEKHFQKFVDEYCILGSEHSCNKMIMLGAYRYWNKCLSEKTKKQFATFMNKHFQTTRKYVSEYNTTLSFYSGIKPKEFDANIDITKSKYDEFINSEFKFGYTFRIPFSVLLKEYTSWMSIKYPGHNIDKLDIDTLRAFMNKHFLNYRINMPGFRGVNGYWCLQLKSNTDDKIGLIEPKRKKIAKINLETNGIVEEYHNLEHAAHQLNIDPKRLSTYIKAGTKVDNYIYQFL